jgi:catechol 2,3-dioxygenase-like lactoylglutathione lyase family enzyme
MTPTASPQPQTAANVQQVIPFFRIADIDRSLRFYLDGLGFTLKNKWVVDNKIRWCMLELGGAALMLQTFEREDGSVVIPPGKLGEGVSLAFQCADAVALYREFISRGIPASEPQVGNNMWVTGLTDPDGYRLEFASLTDVAEDTKLSELKI